MSAPAHVAMSVSGRVNSAIPARVRRKLTEYVPLIPGGVNFTIEAIIERVKYTPNEIQLFGE
jgi:hypothetical protein